MKNWSIADHFAAVLAELDEVYGQLADAKVDAERLEWLSKCTSGIEDYNECWACWGGGTLREAIDAAMKESKDANEG